MSQRRAGVPVAGDAAIVLWASATAPLPHLPRADAVAERVVACAVMGSGVWEGLRECLSSPLPPPREGEGGQCNFCERISARTRGGLRIGDLCAEVWKETGRICTVGACGFWCRSGPCFKSIGFLFFL